MSGVFAPSCHVALQDVHLTFRDSAFSFPDCVFVPSSGRMMTKEVAPFPAAHLAEFHLWLATPNSTVLLTVIKQR